MVDHTNDPVLKRRSSEVAETIVRLRARTRSKTVPQLLLAFAYWYAVVLILATSSTPGFLAVLPSFVAGLAFSALVISRLLVAATMGEPFRHPWLSFEFLFMFPVLFIWYTIWLAFIPPVGSGRWHGWVVWFLVPTGLLALLLGLLGVLS